MSAATAGSPARSTAAGSDAPMGNSNSPPADSPISVSTEGTTVVLTVERRLDTAAGDALLLAATAALSTAPDRLDIDLRSIDGYTEDGARALVECRSIGAGLAGGLHYRTGRGPGREALLAAYSSTDDELAPE
jgi:hypothetical protein